MASPKVMASSNPRNSDLTTTAPTATTIPTATTPTVTSSTRTSSSRSRRRQRSNFSPAKPLTSDVPVTSASSIMTVDGNLRNIYSVPSSESSLLNAQISLIDNPLPSHHPMDTGGVDHREMTDAVSASGTVPFPPASVAGKTYDEVWREIVAGRREMKEEPQAEQDEMMTLEDFLAKAGAVDVEEEIDLKMSLSERLSGGVYGFDAVSSPQSAFQMLDNMEGSIISFGSGMEVGSRNIGGGRVKRGRSALLEPLDKAAQQRQRRMIKNRESAARSRERKQAYQVELETLAVKLEEEHEQLLREKEERTKERFKQLMENVVPVVERRRQSPHFGELILLSGRSCLRFSSYISSHRLGTRGKWGYMDNRGGVMVP